ncbi:MAG: geranylgeranylglyceryl/heptaprenylglyceryl phosphate synthase [Hadesarchaea archaeon]|nr:geranylgeranylglyceryl/heptaprenylglyceryl phosphate synthase [Hadesarchaea archaeon]
MSVREHLNKVISMDGAAHLTLIDPDEQEPHEAAEMSEAASRAGTDAIMVGGSSRAEGELLDETILHINKRIDLPVILFPGGETGVSKHADAIFFMSLLNSNDPYFITRAQSLGAPIVKKFGLEPISMAYIIISPGGTVGKVGKADLIQRDEPEKATSYALAAKYLGMSMIYLEAGSGAEEPVPLEMIKQVKETTELTLITGGGIKTPESTKKIVSAGADLIVTGTLVEESQDLESEIRGIVGAVKGE